MASKGAHKRLTKEYITIAKNPPDYIVAKPLESNILEWHYVIRGPPDSVYEGGEYHGKVQFPADYPFKPPSIKMMTPNGRFQTDYKLCLSMSDYHPQTWNPAWSVSTILTGLLSFMLEDAPTTGSIKTSDDEKRIHARKSHQVNLANARFKEVFPELCTPDLAPLANAPTKSLKSALKQPIPSSNQLVHRRNGPPNPAQQQQQQQQQAPATNNAVHNNNNNPHHAVPVVPAAAHAANSLWNSIRSNAWRSLLLGVLLYLVVLKIANRVAEHGRDM
ncbi:ubiquitin-conjugating enzyme/RWD-like protein [Powellomyces hirtus]|nr:ubiquitin-conjugating enzyme/RWD-like protein [Powellomyces hirtus]